MTSSIRTGGFRHDKKRFWRPPQPLRLCRVRGGLSAGVLNFLVSETVLS
jgi:hypothetical protein